MSTGYHMKIVEIVVSNELWKEVEDYRRRSNSALANVPGYLIRKGLEAIYTKYPNLCGD